MTSIQILYESDHQDRAVALMGALTNSAVAGPMDTTPVKIKGLKTLIFWGHGQSSILCNMNSKAVIATIIAWKTLNSDLKVVEVITCNARHYDNKFWNATVTVHRKSKMMHNSGSPINNSIVKQIKRGLKYNINPALWSIKVLALPESVRGSLNQYSILYWDAATTSWCYVTGRTETEMFTVGACIKQSKKLKPDPTNIDDRYDAPRTGDFPARVAAAKIDFPKEDYSDVIAGKLFELRDHLVEVK